MPQTNRRRRRRQQEKGREERESVSSRVYARLSQTNNSRERFRASDDCSLNWLSVYYRMCCLHSVYQSRINGVIVLPAQRGVYSWTVDRHVFAVRRKQLDMTVGSLKLIAINSLDQRRAEEKRLSRVFLLRDCRFRREYRALPSTMLNGSVFQGLSVHLLPFDMRRNM